MKRQIFIILILILTGLNISSAYYYEMYHKCGTETCASNSPITFNLTFQNQATRELEITSISIFENDTKKKVAWHNDSKIVVHNTDNESILIKTYLPIVEEIKNITYYPCITSIGTRENRLFRSSYGLEIEYCYINKLYSLIVNPCNINKDCSFDEICINKTCEKLKCDTCQYIISHSCIKHECCNSTDCEGNQTCEEKRCILSPCKENEVAINHTCIVLECEQDEHIFNNTCSKLICDGDEQPVNHTCRKLECRDNEFASNHMCNLLECRDNEYGVNHRCELLNCSALSKPKRHKCKMDFVILLILLSELISWSIIVFVATLFIKKYKKRHLPKTL